VKHTAPPGCSTSAACAACRAWHWRGAEAPTPLLSPACAALAHLQRLRLALDSFVTARVGAAAAARHGPGFCVPGCRGAASRAVVALCVCTSAAVAGRLRQPDAAARGGARVGVIHRGGVSPHRSLHSLPAATCHGLCTEEQSPKPSGVWLCAFEMQDTCIVTSRVLQAACAPAGCLRVCPASTAARLTLHHPALLPRVVLLVPWRACCRGSDNCCDCSAWHLLARACTCAEATWWRSPTT
jgi:hypothetical protein